MKNLQILLGTIVFLGMTISGCGQEPPDTLTSKVYESCCGTEPVEFNHPNLAIYLYVPNVFTPNGDGINDKFAPVINGQIRAINYMVIQKEVTDDTTSTLLYQVEDFDVAELANYAWDGKNPKGEMHVGLFKYTISFSAQNGMNYGVKGGGCSIICGPEAAVFKNKSGCFFSIQGDSSGHLNIILPNKG